MPVLPWRLELGKLPYFCYTNIALNLLFSNSINGLVVYATNITSGLLAVGSSPGITQTLVFIVLCHWTFIYTIFISIY
jgi:hypothetical protein